MRESKKWATTTCSGCGTALTEDTRVEQNRRKRKPCRNTYQRSRYIPKGPPLHSGPPPNPARDGDKRQARKRVNQLVLCGRLPRPNDLPCADCGLVWDIGDKRHEYDHYLGYAAEHHTHVQSVCASCHHKRSIARGEWGVRRG